MADVKIISKQNGVAIVLPTERVLLGDPDGDYVAEAGALSTQVSIKRSIDDFLVVKDLPYTNIKDSAGAQIGTSRDNCISVLNSTYFDPATKLGNFDDIVYDGTLVKGQVLTVKSTVDGLRWQNAEPKITTVTEMVTNDSGGTLTKGTPVHITSEDAAGIPQVIAARADTASAMPAHFILNEDLDDAETGEAILIGMIADVDTSGFSSGDVLYVGATGGYTTTRPSATNLVQNIGVISHVDATEGTGYVTGAGRSNDLPNLGENKIWVGDSSGVAEAVRFPVLTLANISGRYQWTSSDNGERVFTGNTNYGPFNWYSFTSEPGQAAMRNYSGTEVVGTTTVSMSSYLLIAYAIKNPYAGKRVRLDYDFRIFASPAVTTGTTFGMSIWSANAPATGSTANSTYTYRGEGSDHDVNTSSIAHHHGSFTTSDVIDDDYILVLPEHRDSTGINGNTYMYVNFGVYMVD